MRAPASGRHLHEDDAALAKGMIARGDRQHDIAAYFAVNGGRIGEISNEQSFEHVEAVTENLPPAAPYLVVEAKHRNRLSAALHTLQAVDAVPEHILIQLQELLGSMEMSHAWRDGK